MSVSSPETDPRVVVPTGYAISTVPNLQLSIMSLSPKIDSKMVYYKS